MYWINWIRQALCWHRWLVIKYPGVAPFRWCPKCYRMQRLKH
jgi:hypothetical protein